MPNRNPAVKLCETASHIENVRDMLESGELTLASAHDVLSHIAGDVRAVADELLGGRDAR